MPLIRTRKKKELNDAAKVTIALIAVQALFLLGVILMHNKNCDTTRYEDGSSITKCSVEGN